MNNWMGDVSAYCCFFCFYLVEKKEQNCAIFFLVEKFFLVIRKMFVTLYRQTLENYIYYEHSYCRI